MNLFVTLIIFTVSSVGHGAPGNGNCQWNPNIKTLSCTNFRNDNNSSPPGEKFMESILWKLGNTVVSQVNVIHINQSFILDLNLEQFDAFPSLTHLTIHKSHVCSVWGTVPKSLISLNLSYNVLMTKDFDPDAFQNSQLEDLNLSYNKLDQLPNNTLENLPNLKALSLIGNEVKCSWVTGTKFYKWASKNEQIIQDIDSTFCLPAQDAVFANMTFLAALKVRKTGLEECNKAKCECDIWTTHVVEKGEDSAFKSFPVVHSNKYGKVYFTLKLDCSNMGLEELPSIPPYTTVLVINNNGITDLSRLNTDNDYIHVTHISLNNNLVDDLDSITNTKFFDRVQFFGIKNNSMTRITENTIRSIFSRSDSMRRINNISLGENTIYCDCNTFIKLRSSLIAHESIIKDWKTIRCKSQDVTLHELKYKTACQIKEAEGEEWPWWIVITIECFLIIIVLMKLWNDRRHYIRTGQLPSLSSCMPRLPCDFMLERIEDSKMGHHANNKR